MLIIISILSTIVVYLCWKNHTLNNNLEHKTELLFSYPNYNFEDIKVGDRFEHRYYDSWGLEYIVNKYILIQAPDSRYQLVEVDKNDKIIGSEIITEDLEEVKTLLKELCYYKVLDKV